MAKTSRHTADYPPAGPNSKSSSAKSYTRSTTNLLSRKADNILMMLACTFLIQNQPIMNQTNETQKEAMDKFIVIAIVKVIVADFSDSIDRNR